jgi:hypothetical protein
MGILSARIRPIIILVGIPLAMSIIVQVLHYYDYPIAEIATIQIQLPGITVPLNIEISGIYLISAVTLFLPFIQLMIRLLKEEELKMSQLNIIMSNTYFMEKFLLLSLLLYM